MNIQFFPLHSLPMAPRLSPGQPTTLFVSGMQQPLQPIGEPLRGHEDSALSVAFSPDGSQIESGSTDDTVRVWSAGAPQPGDSPLRGYEDSVQTKALASSGSYMLSGSEDKSIWVSDSSSRSSLPPLLDHLEHNIKKIFTVHDSTSARYPVVYYLLHDGWAVNYHLQRLFWIPHHLHMFLSTPRAIGIIGSREMVVLDTSACRLGVSWEFGIAKDSQTIAL
ncbi:hypothetical protein DL96DRAFT_6252 [Flagelloscypha sp. PMI_526]|nr:hypothetical protein DL96DRAFT_6252 [Flagelloscypha sp. PMI_526]